MTGHRLRAALCLGALLALACTRPEDTLEEIRALHRQGRHEETIERLRELVDEDPSRAEANLLLGAALFHSGNSGLAVWPLRKASETPEYAVEAGLLLTRAMLESRTAPDAIEEIDRVLELEPDNVEALVLRAEAFQATGSLEEALVEIDRVRELDPDNLAVLVPRVTALIALRRVEDAEAALADASERFRTTERSISDTMRARLCVARGLFAFEKGDPEAAEPLYEACIEQFPTDHLAVTQAVEFYGRTGRQDRADEILERAFEQSQDGFFRVALARRKSALNDPEAAERLLREEAEARGTPMAWFALADYYVQQERFDDALREFERALAAAPPGPRLRFAYADTLVRAGQLDKAERVARRLEHPELRNLIRGRILFEQGDWRGALAAFEAGVRLWPNNATGRFLAGQAAEHVGDFTRAVSHYRESFRAAPADSEAGLALIELYAAQGEADAALRIAARYVRSHRGDPQAVLASIRVAHAAGAHPIVAEGLQRLTVFDGQAPVAAAEEAALLAESKGPEAALAALDPANLDLADPANAVALRARIDYLAALSRHGEALAAVDAALAAHPQEPVLHELRGRALRAKGEPAAAREAYERALELDAENARALAGLAALAGEAGDVPAALALYDRASAADEDDPAPALAAIALAREADPDDAARRLEALLSAHPRQAAAANDLANLLADRGELDRAQLFADRAAWFRLPAADATLARIQELRGQPAAAADGAT